MRPKVKVVIATSDPKMITALTVCFVDQPDVLILEGSVVEQAVDAWASGTGTNGGLDSDLGAAIKAALGDAIERAVQTAVHARYEGDMPSGHATCVETARPQPRFLISTTRPDDALDVALAAGAALQVVHMQNKLESGSIGSVALPAFTADGVSAQVCAELMWTACDLFREAELPNFETMSIALQELLRNADPADGKGAFKKSFATPQSGGSQVSTIPDSAAAAAQLKRKLTELDDSES